VKLPNEDAPTPAVISPWKGIGAQAAFGATEAGADIDPEKSTTAALTGAVIGKMTAASASEAVRDRADVDMIFLLTMRLRQPGFWLARRQKE
jgi:hypothetical protein